MKLPGAFFFANSLLLYDGNSSGSLLCRHRLNNELMATLGRQRRFGPLKCSVNECSDFRALQRDGGVESNASHHIAAAAKQSVRIRETGALQETQANALRLSGQGKNGIAGLCVWPVADDEEIIVVVHKLQRLRDALAHFQSGRANQGRHFRRELRDEACKQFLGCGALHSKSTPGVIVC
jgi:hypothetical protein